MNAQFSLSRTPSPRTTVRHLRTVCAGRFLPLLLLCALPTAGQAQCYAYTTSNGKITITDYTCSGTVLAIPSMIYGLPVTQIGAYAFDSCGSLASVTIPNSVASLGDGAFMSCSSLASATIPNRVVSILGYTFAFCTSLTNVTIPNSITTIGGHAFDSCSSLTSVAIPDSVATIAIKAFFGCRSLTSLTLGDSVTTIGDWAFSFCTNLTSVTLSSSVTTIGLHAFDSCTSLTNITIPNSVTSIGQGAFKSCSSLMGVYFKGNAPVPGLEVFSNAVNACVYYLPGTTGWSNRFAGIPTALWQLPYPVILTGSPEFGVKTNAFGFIISWATNATVVVEATTNLSSWTPIATNTITMGIAPLTDGWSYFRDPDWTNSPTRFYRLRSP